MYGERRIFPDRVSIYHCGHLSISSSPLLLSHPSFLYFVFIRSVKPPSPQ